MLSPCLIQYYSHSIDLASYPIVVTIGVSISRPILVLPLRDGTAACPLPPVSFPTICITQLLKSNNDLIHAHS
jgi:hypothetical protein